MKASGGGARRRRCQCSLETWNPALFVWKGSARGALKASGNLPLKLRHLVPAMYKDLHACLHSSTFPYIYIHIHGSRVSGRTPPLTPPAPPTMQPFPVNVSRLTTPLPPLNMQPLCCESIRADPPPTPTSPVNHHVIRNNCDVPRPYC